MLPDTYVRPHRHVSNKCGDDRWELFVIVKGEAIVVTFNHEGKLQNRYILNPNTENIAIEIPPNTWHSVAITKNDTVMFESKPGPYLPMKDKDFAIWAPKEKEQKTKVFINWFIHGKLGSLPPT